MDYLDIEFKNYVDARGKGKSYEEFALFKAFAFQSLLIQINSYLSKKTKVLEVGFGSGYFLSLLSQNGHEVYGVEKSENALRYAKEIFNEKKQSSKNLMIADGFKLPFPDNSFDLVFNIGVIEHFSVSEQRIFISEMKRVSKKLVLISVPNHTQGSLYSEFKIKSNFYIAETENIVKMEYLVKLTELIPIKYSGFLTIRAKDSINKELDQLYRKHKFIAKESYSPKDFPNLLKFEMNLSDDERFSFGFLKYFLAEK